MLCSSPLSKGKWVRLEVPASKLVIPVTSWMSPLTALGYYQDLSGSICHPGKVPDTCREDTRTFVCLGGRLHAGLSRVLPAHPRVWGSMGLRSPEERLNVFGGVSKVDDKSGIHKQFHGLSDRVKHASLK